MFAQVEATVQTSSRAACGRGGRAHDCAGGVDDGQLSAHVGQERASFVVAATAKEGVRLLRSQAGYGGRKFRVALQVIDI